MTQSPAYPETFGIATVAQDMKAARDFYTALYPYEVKENVFAGIKFFSIMGSAQECEGMR